MSCGEILHKRFANISLYSVPLTFILPLYNNDSYQKRIPALLDHFREAKLQRLDTEAWICSLPYRSRLTAAYNINEEWRIEADLSILFPAISLLRTFLLTGRSRNTNILSTPSCTGISFPIWKKLPRGAWEEAFCG